ncbi:hypothetical protein [Paenibacillus sp. Marseille-Q4541]|uniref:hypothetical protein n=1 Tax=Paenibacillus sp. Marseille-Q4541 TaxID=2831522 RepID=UPI001BAAB28D|nr:hypothetical protein [Paenibacillus sp. Marseille-Q4541]
MSDEKSTEQGIQDEFMRSAAAEDVVLPQDPGEWGDTIGELEEELPQDPNVLLMDVDAIYAL